VASSSKQRVTHNRSAARAAECDVTIVHLDAVQRVRAVLPDEMVMQRVAATFQILADPVRASIIYALAHQELCVCDVAVVAGLSISAASHQLKRLRDQDVVAYRKEGRLAFYSLRDERMRRLIEDGLAHAQSRQ
jgi:ArsR family transcriptional regulator, lead/cadmium/zinc/bismuth-responsive transcriptional repressor